MDISSFSHAAAAAALLQLCRTLCDHVDRSPPGYPIPGILQARTLEWVAISLSNQWKWKVKVKSLSRVQLFETPWTAAHRAPPSMGFSMQEYWSGAPSPSPILTCYFSLKVNIFRKTPLFQKHCFCSVNKSCLTLWDHTDCSMPGSPVLHYLPELLKFVSIESVMLSNHLILCHLPLLLLSVFPNIRVFSNELALHIRWPKKYWIFSFSNSPPNKYSELSFQWIFIMSCYYFMKILFLSMPCLLWLASLTGQIYTVFYFYEYGRVRHCSMFEFTCIHIWHFQFVSPEGKERSVVLFTDRRACVNYT